MRASRNECLNTSKRAFLDQKSRLNALFERDFGPLLTFFNGNFEVYPLDGDYFNENPDNFLLSGPMKRAGIDDESAVRGEVLRLFYDPETDDFSYIYKQNGRDFELRGATLGQIRRKVQSDTNVPRLRNRKYLLTTAEYGALLDDVEAGLVRLDAKNLHVWSYKNVNF